MEPAIASSPSLLRQPIIGFVAGAIAVATFHQLMVLALATAGLTQGAFYSLRPIPPLGVPEIVNQMFWGGVWGVVFALIVDRLPPWRAVVIGPLFGLCGPVLFGWTVMALIRHEALFGGFEPRRMLASVLINSCYGLGLGLIFAGLRRGTPRVA
jgi:hypothetical protein